MVWKTYKKEIMEREKEEKDFLRNYHHRLGQDKSG